ncbi:phage tail protein [Pseudocitrobacter vendiensis]|uniref:Variable tail fibre protein n=1 Tax=Pseudocitrobacter vendiensis TaxID=2488306 RepID=A0ABM9FFH2_9ENTR|nr:phage tail protein [Pseudocitrobacter vendiensis]CAH6661968.1 Variable tail fibre protein [Pseudocitrobacter vendiensis]
MARQYYGILTTKGRALYANALLLNQDVNLSEMAIDDTVNFLPDEKLESLPSEVYRAELNSLEKDEDNDEMVIAELVIPSQRGGFYCRGFGLYTDTGILFAVGSLAETYKATEDEGSGGELVIQADIVVTNTAALVLKVDPTTVLATRETVDRAIAAHEAKLDPHPQYAPKNSPTLTGIPKAPTPAAGNNTTQIATTAFVQAIATALNTALALKAPLASPGLTGTPTAPTAAQSTNNTQIATTAFVKSAIAALVASSPAALDTLNELAAALGNDPNFATTMTNALAGKQPLDSTLTNLSGKDVAGLLSYLGLGEAAKLAAATGSLSASGWLKIPIFGGASVILQWGKVALTATLNSGAAVKGYDGVTVFNYPISFPNAALIVNATPMDSGETLVETATANGTSKTAATVRVGGVAIKSDPAATVDLHGFVFAIGY